MDTIIFLFVSALRTVIKNPAKLVKLKSLLLPIRDALTAAFPEGARSVEPTAVVHANLNLADQLLADVANKLAA